MKKSKLIVMLALAILLIGSLVFFAIDGGNPDAVKACSHCDGSGVLDLEEACEECNVAYAEYRGLCHVCDGSGFVAAESAHYASWAALIAPVVAIVLALITKEVYSSLIVGIIVGAMLVANFDPVKTVDHVIQNGLIQAVSGTAGIFVFLVLLGIMVALVNKAGGSAAFGRWASKNIKSRTGAMIATFVLGVLIFIDDYFNCLTVGGVMRPVTDRHKISRAKLSFIIDATAAPVCMIAPISSWAAAVSSNIEGDQGIATFVQAIPYNLYSLLTLGFVLAIALMKLDFGPMKRYELMAKNGDVTGGVSVNNAEDEEEGNSNGRVLDLVLPVVVLVVACVLALVYVGGFFGGDYNGDFIGAFGNTDATVGLPLGGFVALVFTIIYLIARRIVTFKGAMECIPKGFIAMVPAILILTMATGLKDMTGLLGADVFVEGMMANAAGLANFLPAIIFLVAVGLSFSTGTSWGTFGILIPIVLSVFPAGTEMQIIGISACLAGAVCGDHCSPISDTTIMSSAGAQCDHVMHVSTQLPYAMTVAAISFVGYIVAGFVQNAVIVLAVSFTLMLGTLFVIKALSKKRNT